MEDTRVESNQEILEENNSTKASEQDNNQINLVPRAIRKYKKSASSFNTVNTNVELAGKAYLEGKITAKEWSLMSPALRKAIERYAKKHKCDKEEKFSEETTI